MIFKELFQEQKKLDEKIILEHNLQGQDLFNKKIVALIVELGELANEVRFFKFWSGKAPASKETILEEYVDCIHFMLSLGNDLNIEEVQTYEYKLDLNYESLTEDFIDIVNQICVLKNIHDFATKFRFPVERYIIIFEELLRIGHKLGFSFKDIEMAYYKKHEINMLRQDSDY